MFCVYVHKRKTDDRIFYVGKGREKRARSRKPRNEYWKRVADKYGWYSEIVESGLTHEEAIDLEVRLIKEIGRKNLTNLTDGGEGTPGRIVSEKTKSIMSKRFLGTRPNEECIEASRVANRKPVGTTCGLRFESMTDAVGFLVSLGHKKASRASISSAVRGLTNAAYGYEFRALDDKGQLIPNDFKPKNTKKKVGTKCGLVFEGITDAADWVIENGLSNASKSSVTTGIVSCCKNKSGMFKVYGYHWGYMEGDKCLFHEEKQRKGHAVYTSCGKRFRSVNGAAKWISPHKRNSAINQNIRKAAASGGTYMGYQWFFEHD